MQRRTLLLLGGAAAVVLGGALLLSPAEQAPPSPAGAALAFPGLAQRLQGAARIEATRHDASLAVERRGETWVLPAKGGYPVRQERVRELLTGLTELRLTEPRTANPEMLDRLGLEDPAREGATSTLLRVLDAQGGVIAELVIGRRRVRTQGNVPESAFVRRPNENQAWLAEGRVPVDTDAQLWLDRDIANIPRDRVRRVAVARTGEAPLVVTRSGDPDGRFGLTEPADAPPAEETALDEIGRAFEFLTFLDVRPEAEIPGEALGETRFELTDNLAILVRPRKDGEAVWITLAAEGDDEAARLNARWRGWAYQVGQWKEKAFAPLLADLRRQEEQPAEETHAEPPAGAEPPAPAAAEGAQGEAPRPQ
ncbi:DUF4340 domain-containing protein [Roseomonas alkaliterrae]|uniref:DUF4340 domain-containing protein n=1 Tax=Neoroseomonas alkaliterrae TaxID=1452450 RepID=A0A840YAW3_9PROT|nr:DUF4340 domain-containing protein [Neoroseomonas alkaliterrae]MBB5691014.1 hypothetical protein [Neoroseomonas alkaliterrae]MBR0675828.1 DUF4340 domain-containing protein [Neoroseomonas alkaliterrae]